MQQEWRHRKQSLVIRQLAGKGAGNIAKKVGQRGVKKTGKILRRALKRKGAKRKAGTSAAGNAAMYGDYGDSDGIKPRLLNKDEFKCR